MPTLHKGRKFDRVIRFDARSRNYPARALITATVPRTHTWPTTTTLDQGSVGACVGFSIAQEAAAEPVVVPNITGLTALAVYREAQKLDEYPGEDYEGSSVLGGIKAGKARGWYGEYRWCFSEPELAMAVSWLGPVVLGINWYDGMFDVSASGVIDITGPLVGGHAILCNGYDVGTSMYHLHNSWGKTWGINGGCWISSRDMARLLSEQGEACVPVTRLGGAAGSSTWQMTRTDAFTRTHRFSFPELPGAVFVVVLSYYDRFRLFMGRQLQITIDFVTKTIAKKWL